MNAPSLIERLEAAERGSREFSVEVENALGQAKFVQPLKYDPGSMDHVRVHRPVTESLDAALALAERVLPGWRMHALQDQDGMYQTDNTATRWFCGVSEKRGPGNVMSKSPTPALALCAAILKARKDTL